MQIPLAQNDSRMFIRFRRAVADEDVFFPSEKSGGINCFALLSRTNECRFETTENYISAEFIVEQLDRFSFGRRRLTVISI